MEGTGMSETASRSGGARTVQVEIGPGRLEGLAFERHQAFLGIPFAKPPIGPRRFCAPERSEPWRGVRSAREFGRSAIQGTHPIPGMAASGPRDEDCLYLDVYTPAADGARRPVLFWIHGGGFTMGSGSEPLYDGSRLAVRGDVVVVTIHYRLGALGYLYLGGHGGAAWGATANAGQLDQIAALEWVRENIAAFGGDADDVTIFGESAGSAAVATLLAMPAARGLFRRAILQSGTANRLGNRETGERLAARILAELGLATHDAAAIREVPAEAILKAQLAVAGTLGRELAFAPIIDGATLPESPLDAVRRGVAADIPLIIGSNRDEAKLFNASVARSAIDEPTLVTRVAALLPRAAAEDGARALVATYRRSREARALPATGLDLLDAIQGDLTFRIGAIRLAEAQRPHQPHTYLYLFTYESPARRGALGACHALELPFVFGTLDAPTQDRFAGTGPIAGRLSENMMAAWLAFARRSDPSHPGIGAWAAYDADRRATMIFGSECGLEYAPFEEERAAWEGIA
jgi:para-nitrobenzyl esterase